ncbi:MAG TPA: hypothetical protein PKC49_03340 [Phycisphaerae bacterium]|nr:hypothetical protein [Phycisphaerae bacterium]
MRDWWYAPPDDLTASDPGRDRLYRPLTLFTFALNYAVDALNPLGYHAVNVALHVLCTWLTWRLALRVLRAREAAVIAALLFAVHPVHCVAVANVVGRAELLAAAFILAGLLLLTRRAGPPGLASAASAAGAFLLATLSKETAVCYPLVALIVLHHLYGAQRPGWRWWLTRTAVLSAPLLLYFPLRYVALEGRLVRDEDLAALFNPLFQADAWGRLVGPLTILGHYARLLLLPSKLSADYGMGVISPTLSFDPWSLAMTGLGVLAAAALLTALLGYGRPRGSAWRELAMLTAMLLASYALISNTVLLIGVSLAERLMYWPSVPALLLIASLIVEWWRRACTGAGPLAHRAGLLRVAGLLLLGALCVRTITRNAAWADDATLFSTDLAEWPNNAQMLVTRARQLVYDASHADDPRERLALLSTAEALASRSLSVHASASAYRVMGELLGVRGERERALQYLYLARQINPRDLPTQAHIAALEGRDVDAEAAVLSERIAARPDDVALRMELAALLVANGRHRTARPHLEHVLRLQPDHLAAQRLMAQVHMLDHEPEPAIALFRAVLEHDPNDWDSHLNLAYLLQLRDPPACLEHARRAAELRPDDLRTQAGLAEALLINGRRDEALTRLRQLLASLPPADPMRSAVAERIQQIERRGR